MNGTKKVFRLLSGIYVTVLSGLQTLGLIILLYRSLTNDPDWTTMIYFFMIIFTLATLINSASLCSKKPQNGTARRIIVYAGIILLFKVAMLIIAPSYYTIIIEMLLWIVAIVFCSIYLGVKEVVSSTQNYNNSSDPKNSVYLSSDSFASPKTIDDIESKIAVFDKLKAEGKLTEEEYKNLLMDELKK